MLGDIVVYVVIGLGFASFHYLLDRWNSRAPAPDGLYPDERLIVSMRTRLKIDDATVVGFGFAYLTDLRLVWTPQIGGLFFQRALGEGPYGEPVIVELSAIRKVDLRFYFGGSRLIIEAVDIRLELRVRGRSFGSWERLLKASARNLLPADQPLLRTRDRYSRTEVLAASKGTGLYLGLLLVFFGARTLETVFEAGGDSLSQTQFIGIVVAVVALLLAAYVWETRPR
jgi:hypothetical protein